jgi:hypothetical protein
VEDSHQCSAAPVLCLHAAEVCFPLVQRVRTEAVEALEEAKARADGMQGELARLQIAVEEKDEELRKARHDLNELEVSSSQ